MIFGAIIAIILLAMASGGSFIQSVTGDVKPTLQGMVGLPQFASARCQAGSIGQIASFDMKDAYAVPNAPYGTNQMYKEFGCSDINAKECTFEYKVSSTIGSLFIYKVPANTVFKGYSDFADFYTKGYQIVANNAYMSATDGWKNAGTFNFNSEYYRPTEKIIVMAQDVPFGGFLDAGDLAIKVSAQQYDLDSTTDSGLRTAALNTCELSKIHTSGTRDILEKDFLSEIGQGDVKVNANGRYVLLFDRTVNYIGSLVPVVETQDIIKRNGVWVWVKQPSEVCPIEPSPKDFGSIKYYADCRVPISAPEIVCRPSTPNCKPDGTGYLTTNEPKTCNFYGGGLPTGYYPNYIDNKFNEYCKFTCEGGVVKTNNCVTIKNCDAGYKFDFDKNSCVKVGSADIPNIGGEPDYTWLIIGGAILLGLMLLGTTYALSGKKKR